MHIVNFFVWCVQCTCEEFVGCDCFQVGQCFELELPACSLPYDVECVTLLTMRQSSSPACLVVSPDGLLRYWFNVSLDTSFAEVNIADLRGELPTALVNTQVRETVAGVLISLACFFSEQSYYRRFHIVPHVFNTRVPGHCHGCAVLETILLLVIFSILQIQF